MVRPTRKTGTDFVQVAVANSHPCTDRKEIGWADDSRRRAMTFSVRGHAKAG